MFTDLLHLGLLTLLWQTCTTQGTHAISCENVRFFFSRVQMGRTWTTPQPALGLLATPPNVFCQCFHLSACPEAAFAAPHGLCWAGHWTCWIGQVPQPLFSITMVCEAKPSVHPRHACTLSSAISARHSCVHALPQSVLAVLSYLPSSTR